MYIHIYTNIQTHIYTHIHTHTNTLAHIHIHIYNHQPQTPPTHCSSASIANLEYAIAGWVFTVKADIEEVLKCQK